MANTIDLSAIDRDIGTMWSRLLDDAFDVPNGGGMLNDLKAYGSEGSTSYFHWDYSLDKCFIQRTTTNDSPGRLVYIQHLGSAMKAGQNIQGIQIRSRATGTGNIAGGSDGAEIKAGLHSDADTGTLAAARGVIANVDAKKGTITTAYCVEAVADIGVGGKITTLQGVRAKLVSDGACATGYAFYVDAEAAEAWNYGVYIAAGMVSDVGFYMSGGTTGIQLAGVQTTGITIASATTGINVTTTSTTVLTGALAVAAATGDYSGLSIDVANTLDRTAGHIMKGASINVNPLATKTVGNVYGLEACVYIGGTTTVNGTVRALFAEIQGGTTISSDYYAIYAYMAAGATPAGASAVIRAEHNAAAARCNRGFLWCVGDASYAFGFGPNDIQTAYSHSGSPSNQAGWLKVLVGSSDRWILLYDTAP